MVVIVTPISQIMRYEYEIFRFTHLLLGNSSQCLDQRLLYIYVCVLVLRPPTLSWSALRPQRVSNIKQPLCIRGKGQNDFFHR